MSANAKLPLTEPQHRHLTVCLATLERQLQGLRERLKRRPRDSRLVHYEDPLVTGEADALLPVITEAENRLRRMADELALGALTEPVRGAAVAGLELASIHLYGCRAKAGLGGYGAVAPATADYLEREIPKLDEVLQPMLRLLRHPPASSDSDER
jgi:hypothetical protein